MAEVKTPRPTQADPAVICVAVERLAVDVVNWLAEDYRAEEYFTLITELMAATSRETDGYQIARYLETRCHWEGIDFELVEILDGAWCCLHEATVKAIKAWLPKSGLVPRLMLGATTTVDGHAGTIVGVDLALGTYSVYIPTLGHVPAGQVGTQGRIIAWEVLDGGV